MTAPQALSEYFMYKFQGLKRCQFQYEPESSTLAGLLQQSSGTGAVAEVR